MIVQQAASWMCRRTRYRLQLPLPIQRLYLRRLSGEPEISLLPLLCSKDKIALDIGAARGLYSLFLLDLCREVIAFEPLPENADDLEARFRATDLVVHRLALGEKAGELEFRTPIAGRHVLKDWSSLTKTFSGSVWNGVPITSMRTQTIPVATLDSLRLSNIGFVKIDVEGFEEHVLKGSVETLTISRPSMILEIEDRHRDAPIESTFEMLRRMDFVGFFLWRGSLLPLEKFRKSEMQSVDCCDGRGEYVSNFVWIPRESETLTKLTTHFDSTT